MTLLALLISTLLMAFSSQSMAQGMAQATGELDLSDALSDVLKERADKVLTRYLSPTDFQVEIQVTATEAGPQLPYLPADMSASTLRNLSRKRLNAYIKQVQVSVYLPKAMAEKSRTAIARYLENELGLDKQRGDQIQTSTMEIEGPGVGSIESDLRASQKTASELQQTRNDLKQELTIAKSEIDRLSRDLTTKAAELASAPKGGSIDPKTGAPAEMTATQLFKSYAPHLIIATGALLVLAIFVLAFFSSGKRLGSAVGDIARAMEGVGENLGQIGQNGSMTSGAENPFQKQLNAIAQENHDAQRPSSIPMIPLESLQTRLESLHEQISSQFSAATESIILRHLTQLLADQTTIARAVVTMELMGRDKANELFGRLNIESQDAILRFLKRGTYGRAKGELMLEAGEEILTKLMADSFSKIRCEFSNDVTERLLKLSPEELVKLFQSLEPNLLPRLMLYLDAVTVTSVLKSLKGLDRNKFTRMLTMLARIPEAERDINLDKPLLAALDVEISRLRTDAHRPYLKFYQEIIASSDEDLGEEIVNNLAQANPRLEKHLRRQMLSINTLLMLGQELRQEIVASLSNKEIAALATGMRTEDFTLLVSGLSARRRPMIDDEIESLRSSGKSQETTAYRKVKANIIAKLKTLQAQGISLEQVSGSEQTDTTVANQDDDLNDFDSTIDSGRAAS